MRKLICLIAISLAGLCSFGQKQIPQPGQISLEELKMKACSFDENATAMKLFEIQEREYEHTAFGGKIQTSKRVRIKIFNEKGYQHATVRIPYFANKNNTKVNEISGTIYWLNEAGKIDSTKVAETDFYKNKEMDKVGMIKFTFPHLVPGAVLEYSYTITEKNRVYFDPWYIQSDIPVGHTSLTLITPGFSSIRETSYATTDIIKKQEVIKKGSDRNKWVFYKENVPAFSPEPYMSSVNDNIQRMAFQLLQESAGIVDMSAGSIWRVAATRLMNTTFFEELQKKEINGTEKYVDTAKKITDPVDRIHYLYNVVSQRFVERTMQSTEPGDLADSWKKKSGTTSEINMILLNLLRRSNLECYGVFISTRDYGKINPDFPNFGQFNGFDVLAINGNQSYLLDASQKFQSFEVPPYNILNRQAFLLDPDNPRWILIEDGRPLFKQHTDLFGILNKEGNLEASATIRYFDYAKMTILDSATTDNSENKFFAKQELGLKILNKKREPITNDDPITIQMDFDLETNKSNEFIFINPLMLSNEKTNPFIKDKRSTDIDFGANQEWKLSLQLEVPADYTVEHVPTNVTVKSPDASFVFTRIVTSDASNISYSHVFEIKKAIFSKEEYAGLYEFFARMHTLMKEEIIFKKKK